MVELAERLAAALAGRYRIESELGHGATSRVYRATDLKHGRPVAIKVLQPELTTVVGSGRFLREIQIITRLAHPNILPLYDSGAEDGLLYYVMPLVTGGSLRDLTQAGRELPRERIARMVTQLAAALDFAHAQGVVHRDIKPGNILLQDGQPVLADFGISLSRAEEERLTDTGLALGTPHYMSPEQAAGAPALDGRSDQYSLACVVYELLAGRPPFTGPTAQSVLAQQLVDVAPPIRSVEPGVSRRIEAILKRALAKRPEDRFPTVGAFAAALERPQHYRIPLRHRRAPLVALLLVLAAAVTAGTVALLHRPEPPRLRERDWVLMADIDAAASNRSLATALRELVTTGLDQSRYLSTMPRQQLNAVMRQAGIAESTTVNADLARELALRSAVRAVVAGRLDEPAPGRYALRLDAVAAEDGADLVSVSDTVPADSLIAAVQRLAERLREGLGERRAAIEANQPLLDIATPSLPAFRLYVDALDLRQRGDLPTSNRLLRQAIALDSGFASAWALLGMNYVERRSFDSARVALGRALEFPARLTPAQRYRLRADAAFAIDYDLEAAVHWYDLYLEEVPHSIGGRNNRALYLSLLGRYEEALGEFERAARDNPFGPERSQPAILNQVAMLISLGRLDRAQAVARNLTGPFADYAGLQLATAGNRWAVAESLARGVPLDRRSPPWLQIEATTTLAASLASRGAVQAADSVLRRAGEAASGGVNHWYRQAQTLLALAASRPLARGTAGGWQDDGSLGGAVWLAARAALGGDSLTMARYLDRLQGADSGSLRRLGTTPEFARALLGRSRARWTEVLNRLAGPAGRGEHDATGLDRVSSLGMRWLVAEARAGRNQPDSALLVLNRAIGIVEIPPGHLSLRGLAFPFAERRQALWADRLGNGALARQHWDEFTKTFRTPDPVYRSLLRRPVGGAAP